MSKKITRDMPDPDHTGFYTAVWTDIERLRTEAKRTGGVVYYGANTCWYTTNPLDLYARRYPATVVNGRRIPSGHLPCDPRGGMLMEAHDVDLFFNNALENAAHYGKHGIRAFVAAHHKNVVVSATDNQPTCFSRWDTYNRVLDEYDARIAQIAKDITKGR